MNELKISLVQSLIVWENKQENLKHYKDLLKKLAGNTDIAVLPEMFTTGFSIQQAPYLAEPNDGYTISVLRSWANEYEIAICGSILAKESSGKIYNRGFFIPPNEKPFFCDKHHLFRMGIEDTIVTPGNEMPIIPYKEWNIRLIVCYDLRFPVWIRNRNNEYDLLICMANWPLFRIETWDTLLKARALENQSYVCGVNRVGEDGLGIPHPGHSQLIDFRGKIVAETAQNETSVVTDVIRKTALETFRRKFPTWMDADKFEFL
jgi:predicted amidohydrolase